MLKNFRCGQCKKLLARMGEYTELQIKCSRCGTLNHVKAASLELSPLSERGTAAASLLPRGAN
ncbi:Com family DNA-binding transcriptional regulator [Pseudomonas syringae]|uniref:Com family DNA-binding transcriptional regulator n=1 Tax=Pseudomonas syringae TaxID=317 RepID=UPI000E322EAF|nr:Com family DNA-binding transcriptional regulator [Pseudomonas syringae]